MHQRKSVSTVLAEVLRLPPQVRPSVPVVELVGKHTLVFMRHRGLKEYTAHCICVDSANGTVRMEGRGLVITKMNSDSLTVTGTIRCVSFAEEGI